MDGVDLALTEISGDFPDLKVDFLGSHFSPYSDSLKTRLLECQFNYSQSINLEEISRLNFAVAKEFANCVNDFLSVSQTSRESIDLIGSHGQTLFHSSGKTEAEPSTLQVGSPSIIAELTGIPTLGNFRVRDMAAGGHGAPLVPLADYILFRQTNKVIALNNLGSISNTTIVTPNLSDLLAFDIGPANMPIDFFARMVPGNTKQIDFNGEISSRGTIIRPLLDDFMALPFLKEAPPRAAGYGQFGPDLLSEKHKKYLHFNPEDLVATALEFSAQSTIQAYLDYVLPRFPQLEKIIFTGGGAKNKNLIDKIRLGLPHIKVETLDAKFSDAKEAIAFAILANEGLSQRAGNVVTVTGAKRPVILGELAF